MRSVANGHPLGDELARGRDRPRASALQADVAMCTPGDRFGSVPERLASRSLNPRTVDLKAVVLDLADTEEVIVHLLT